MAKNVRHLFRHFRPEHYDLNLKPDRDAMNFTGSVTITGQKIGRPSQRITLHQNNLKIINAKITRHDKHGDQNFKVARINYQRSFNEVRLHSDVMLYPGKYTIKLEFSGDITRPMKGIYPCYFEYDGPKMLIATQFESHHARDAFPCIDEPAAKATFDLTLTAPKGEAVIANTPIKKQTTKAGLVTTVFEPTPKMSTYLLAFVYGQLDYLESKTKSGIVVKTYATPQNVKHTKFALDVAVKCLEFYNEYFGIDYPLPKCDLIALPDFASGAMENWGCVTFREQTLFVDSKNTSLSVKQYVAMVVAHELAHQWFGNLVTMRWWTDLWLNEGFASWIEYLATDKLFPEWKMWTQFIVDEQEPALKLDALQHTHPIEVAIHHPDEIATIFDTISYNKGASAIHMLNQYLGAETFRDGLRHYLKTHAYSNTDTIDLWSALEQTSHKPVKEFMHAWTSQAGYPIVHANIEKQLSLNQVRFYMNPKIDKVSELWPVPLLATVPLDQDLLSHKSYKTDLPNTDQPILLNHERSGFYRVVYNSEYHLKLTQLVRTNKLSELDRLSLLSDTTEAAKAGHLSTVDALVLLKAYSDEDSGVVWDIIAGLLGSIRSTMDDEALRDAMKPYIRTVVAKQLKRLGWKPKSKEPHLDTLLRPVILGMAAIADEPNVVKEALRLFKETNESNSIEPDLRGIVYGTVAKKGGKADFDKLLKLYNASSSSEERVTLAAALTNFEQPELIKQALSLINSDAVRLQDVSYWVAYSFMNRHAKAATWQWMTKHWDWLVKNLGEDLSFYRFPVYAARAYSDSSFLPTYKAFFAKNMGVAFERPIAQGVEIIEWQSAWRKRDLASVKTFLKSK